jgi:hypothetical protein
MAVAGDLEQAAERRHQDDRDRDFSRSTVWRGSRMVEGSMRRLKG